MNAFNFSASTDSLKFSQLMRPYRNQIVIGVLWLLSTNIIALSVPRLVNIGVDLVEHKPVHAWFTQMWLLVIVIIGLAAIGAVTRTLSRRAIFHVGRNVERDLRSRLFCHFSIMSSDFFSRRSVGELMTYLNSDISNIRLFTGFAALNFFNIVIVFCGTIPILIHLDWRIAIASLMPFLLVIGGAQLLTGKMFRGVRDYQNSLSKLTEHVQENLSAAQIVRLFHQEEAENQKFAQTNHQTFVSALELSKTRVVMFPLMRMMGSLGVAAALLVGGREVAMGRISLGDYVEINVRLLQLAWPAISFGFIMSVYSQGKASLVRLNDVLAQQPSIHDGDHHSTVLSQLLVKMPGISFSTKRGETIGIVGRSGSGKSMLLRALSRELLIPRGQISLDDVDINDWNLNDLHRRIAVMSSEPFLFSATLRENIVFARPDATDREVQEVVQQVGLSRDIESFAEGLNTLIGERGVMLSGGQRQRVALARALLSDADLLLLDDCLSAVDSETEKHIVTHLKNKRQSPWLIMVSHRLSPLIDANEILVLDKGQIVDRGKHDELLNRPGLYATLWGVQQLEESLNHG